MNDLILNEIKNINCNISILIKDLRNSRILFELNSNRKVPSASIIKVLILLELYNQVDKGIISLSDNIKIDPVYLLEDSIVGEIYESNFTIKDLSIWMIINSDNVATNILIDILTYASINKLSNSLGLFHTELNRKMMDFKAIDKGYNNYTSAIDSLLIMELLYSGRYISEKVSMEIINILKLQRDNSLLKRYIYNNLSIANKTGMLDSTLHDMGIVFKKDIDYFIGIFITDFHEMETAEKLIGRISKITYESL